MPCFDHERYTNSTYPAVALYIYIYIVASLIHFFLSSFSFRLFFFFYVYFFEVLRFIIIVFSLFFLSSLFFFVFSTKS